MISVRGILEMIKPEYGKPIDGATYSKTVSLFESVLKVLHPFMPFITEELWNELASRKAKENIIVASWPQVGSIDITVISEAAVAFDLIAQVRNLRNSKGLSPKEAITLYCSKTEIQKFWSIAKKLANLNDLLSGSEKPAGTSLLVGTTEYVAVLEGKVDAAKEKETILKDLEYQKGFLSSVNKKLENERFVSSAPPQVIEAERKKKADAEAKIKSYEEALQKCLD
jgi:valyl-tRNA synthetase